MDLQPLFGLATGDQWRPGIGDPTPLGWIIVVAYLAASWACWRAAAAERNRLRRARDRPTLFWPLLGLILLFLGINKQLDLQSALTVYARNLARAQGWYAQRQGVQIRFIIGVAASGVVALVAIGWMIRDATRDRLLAMLGLTFLMVFVLIRASSIHHVDQWLGLRFAGLTWNGILELSGIGCVGLAALWCQRTAREGGPPPPRRDAEAARMQSLIREIWRS